MIITCSGRWSSDLCTTNNESMIPNMGSMDRTIRILAAVAIAALYFANVITGTLGVVLLIIAAVFLITGFVSFCPLYAPFKFSTRKK